MEQSRRIATLNRHVARPTAAVVAAAILGVRLLQVDGPLIRWRCWEGHVDKEDDRASCEFEIGAPATSALLALATPMAAYKLDVLISVQSTRHRVSLITPAATDIWTTVSHSSAGEQPYSKPFLPVFKQKNFCESREAAQHANILFISLGVTNSQQRLRDEGGLCQGAKRSVTPAVSRSLNART